MRSIKKILVSLCVAATIISCISSIPIAYASESDAEAFGRVFLPMDEKEQVSVLLPTIGEESPFDFYIDPQGLIYETDAVLQGGGTVEEGAYLLFHNHDGEYDFSKYSDRLQVINQSNVPVIVTITASIGDLGEIEMLGSADFEDREDCSIYLAIVDDEGDERPILEDGEVSVSIEMRKAPDNAYVYRIDEETGEYSYELTTSPEEIDFDSYSFGLVGYCNPNGNWQDISVHPKVTVTWRVEPVLSEEDETDKDNETVMEENETTDTEDEENASETIGVEETDRAEDSETKGDEETVANDVMDSSTSEETENPVNDETEKSENPDDADGGTSDTYNLGPAGTSDTLEQEDTSDADNSDEPYNGNSGENKQ